MSSARPSSAPSDTAADTASSAPRQVTILLFSDNYETRDAVRAAVGRRPARDVEVVGWHECATGPAVVTEVEQGDFDLLILDGESAPVGGLGLTRQLKNEVFNCPPVLVLTGRPQDGWLAAWSQAEAAVPHPLDPIVLANTVADLARRAR
ncbi:MAG: response regulator [Intrasporangiaceae bacterium]|mgnify:CR=1 FL=1|nr:response regulator [Intrasporangiaceae bacterium]